MGIDLPAQGEAWAVMSAFDGTEGAQNNGGKQNRQGRLRPIAKGCECHTERSEVYSIAYRESLVAFQEESPWGGDH